jgi:TolB protein
MGPWSGWLTWGVLALLAPADAGDVRGTREFRLGRLIRLTHDGLDKERPAWSPDGRRLTFARHEKDGAHIWQYLMDVDNPASLHRLTQRDAPEYNAVFAPDGRRLLLVVITLSGTQGNLDIAAIHADGTGQTTVAGDIDGMLSHQDWPAWSPDGKRFAFSSTHENNQEIYTAAADGTDLVRVTQSPGIDAHPCWAPDGRSLVFATDRWGGLELARVGPDGTRVTRLTRSPGLDDYPACSPDGSALAFVSNRDGQFEIYVSAADGSGPTNISRNPLRDTFPTWTPDGLGVTYLSDRNGGFDLYTQPIEPRTGPVKAGPRATR